MGLSGASTLIVGWHAARLAASVNASAPEALADTDRTKRLGINLMSRHMALLFLIG